MNKLKYFETVSFFVVFAGAIFSQLLLDYSSLPIGYESAKVKAVYVIAVICLILMNINLTGKLLRWLNEEKEVTIGAAAVGITALLLVVLTIFGVSAIISTDLRLAMIGSIYRQMGLVSIVALVAIFTYFASVTKKSYIKLISHIYLVIGLIQAGFGAIDALLHDFSEIQTGYYVNGNFGQANFFAATMISCALISYFYLLKTKKWHKLFYLLVFLIFSLNILLSFSYGGWVIFAFIFIIISINYLYNRLLCIVNIKTNLSVPIINFILVIIFSIGLVVITFLVDESRHQIWQTVIILIQEKLGFGYGGFDLMSSVIKESGSLPGRVIDRSHNIVLDLLFAYGLFGFASVISFVSYHLGLLVKRFDTKLIVILIPLVVFFLTSLVHTKSIYHFLEFAVLFGILSSQLRLKS